MTLGGDPANAATSLLYTGEMYDSSASMYYLRARWYDAATGRFNRIDPFAGNTQDPQSLHKYLYCHANPVNITDRSGLFGTYIDVMNTAYIRSVLGNMQFDFGQAIHYSAECAYAGLSVGKALLVWAVTVGAIIGIALLLRALSRLVSRYIGPLIDDLFEKSYNFARRALNKAKFGILRATGRTIHFALKMAFRKKVDFAARWPDEALHAGGFLFGRKHQRILPIGTLVDRYTAVAGALDTGNYLAPVGTPFEMRSLPGHYRNYGLAKYRVARPLSVEAGFTAPWHDPGMGIQFKSERSIAELIADGILEFVGAT